MDAEQRLREHGRRLPYLDADDEEAVEAACMLGADALALLREGPPAYTGQGRNPCVYCKQPWAAHHTPDCWFTRRATLLATATKVPRG